MFFKDIAVKKFNLNKCTYTLENITESKKCSLEIQLFSNSHVKKSDAEH